MSFNVFLVVLIILLFFFSLYPFMIYVDTFFK